MTRLKALIAMLVLVVAPGLSPAQRPLAARPSESGGPLSVDQAAFDVLYYDLSLRVVPATRTISGTLIMVARVVSRLDRVVLDLDDPLEVHAVTELVVGGPPAPSPTLAHERRGSRLTIDMGRVRERGEFILVAIGYSGAPRVAPTPPWAGGFVWSQTADGRPWIGVACQNDGADIWWPCKDHPSDEPDGMALHITVPDGLTVASNGKQGGIRLNPDGTRTFDWLVSQPINNYSVSINIAPYERLDSEIKSISGVTMPVSFWVLPEHLEKGRVLMQELPEYVQFLESIMGPYPFRAEKIGIAETPYLGMEHQTIIAYGADFSSNRAGFDGLLFHELGHEWWGNLVTASDWRDFWLHEGFQSYTDALYAERRAGPAALAEWRVGTRQRLNNVKPLAPREPRTTVQMYLLPPDFVRSDGDIYGKGAMVLDTLRYLIGDKAFFRAFRRMAYPTTQAELAIDGSQCRRATTDEFQAIAEKESAMDLDWFFETYLRSAELPRLVEEKHAGGVRLRWQAPGGQVFPMPIEVKVNGVTRRVLARNGIADIKGKTIDVDPNGRVLKAHAR